MRKILFPFLSLLIFACSSDTEIPNLLQEEINTAPIISSGNFSVAEHSETGTSIGFVTASDLEGDEVTFTIDSDYDFRIDEVTGEITIGNNLRLDFETQQALSFSVSAFDGEIITEQDFVLNVQDVDELTLLTDEQLELVDYFKFLTLWKGPNNSPLDFNQKWDSKMKMYLDGSISNDFNTTVESVVSQFNTLTASGDFDITIVNEMAEANAHVFFGTKSEVEAIWPDMFDLIKDGSYDGYAMTPSESAILISTRIWISNEAEVLFKHELAHSLGFGHSDRCEGEKSFLCSTIAVENDILPIEENVIKYQYHSDMAAGLTASQLEQKLADILLNE